MLAVKVIDNPAAAAVALDPVRSSLLSELAEPASAATLAARLNIARQKVNRHLRALEDHQLVRVAEKRKWGGQAERPLVATAASYVVSPGAMGPVAADPDSAADRLSASYLIALAARIVREVSALLGRASQVEKRLPTLSLDTVIRFRSAADRAAFSQDPWSRTITTNPPPEGARTAWFSSPTLCRTKRAPRSHHERQKRTVRTPLGPGRSPGPRHAGGVWQAIATGPGVSSWFIPTEFDERVGGALIAHFGPGMLPSQPGIRSKRPSACYRMDRRSELGIVRVVHSLLASGEDWDDQLESIEPGWPAFFRILRLYLAHFCGATCSMFQ